MSTLNSTTARSIIYLSCVGGLLIVNSIVVTFIWNDLLDGVMHTEHHLSFLEGTGLSAFAYVVVFSIRYGSAVNRLKSRTSSATQQSGIRKRCAKMSPEDKAALKAELRNHCGCNDQPADSSTDQHHPAAHL
jgi:hypothetical protein